MFTFLFLNNVLTICDVKCDCDVNKSPLVTESKRFSTYNHESLILLLSLLLLLFASLVVLILLLLYIYDSVLLSYNLIFLFFNRLISLFLYCLLLLFGCDKIFSFFSKAIKPVREQIVLIVTPSDNGRQLIYRKDLFNIISYQYHEYNVMCLLEFKGQY